MSMLGSHLPTYGCVLKIAKVKLNVALEIVDRAAHVMWTFFLGGGLDGQYGA